MPARLPCTRLPSAHFIAGSLSHSNDRLSRQPRYRNGFRPPLATLSAMRDASARASATVNPDANNIFPAARSHVTVRLRTTRDEKNAPASPIPTAPSCPANQRSPLALLLASALHLLGSAGHTDSSDTLYGTASASSPQVIVIPRFDQPLILGTKQLIHHATLISNRSNCVYNTMYSTPKNNCFLHIWRYSASHGPLLNR